MANFLSIFFFEGYRFLKNRFLIIKKAYWGFISLVHFSPMTSLHYPYFSKKYFFVRWKFGDNSRKRYRFGFLKKAPSSQCKRLVSSAKWKGKSPESETYNDVLRFIIEIFGVSSVSVNWTFTRFFYKQCFFPAQAQMLLAEIKFPKNWPYPTWQNAS